MEFGHRYYIPPEQEDLAKRLKIPVGVPLEMCRMGFPSLVFERKDTFEKVAIAVADTILLRKDRRHCGDFSTDILSTKRADEIEEAFQLASSDPVHPPKNPFRSTDDYVQAHHVSIKAMREIVSSDRNDVKIKTELLERALLVVHTLKYLLFPTVSSLLNFFTARIPEGILKRHCHGKEWDFFLQHADESLATLLPISSPPDKKFTYGHFFAYFLSRIFLESLREEISQWKKIFRDSKGLWDCAFLTPEDILLIQNQIMPFVRELLTALK